MNQELLGKNLAKLRKEKNLTQEALSELLNIDRTTISKWERGISSPDISMLKDLCNVLDVSINDIFDTDKNQSSNKEKEINNIIKVIDFYEKRKKKKIFIWSALLLIITVVITTSIAIISRTSNYDFFSISENNDNYTINGLLLYNNKRQILLIKEIGYNDVYVGTDKEIKADQLRIILKSKDMELYSYSIINDDDLPLSELLESITIYYDSVTHDNKYKISNKDLCIYIEIIKNNDLLTNTIRLNLKK